MEVIEGLSLEETATWIGLLINMTEAQVTAAIVGRDIQRAEALIRAWEWIRRKRGSRPGSVVVSLNKAEA